MTAATRRPLVEGSRIFSYDEALGMFPLVRELTRSALAQIDALVNPIQSQEEMAGLVCACILKLAINNTIKRKKFDISIKKLVQFN